MSDHTNLTTWFTRTLAQARDEVLQQLGDSQKTIWTAAEIESYLKEGYGTMTLDELLIFDWDKDTKVTANVGVYALPTDLVKIERVTFNSIRLVPMTTRDIEMSQPMYQTLGGWVWAYIADKDGLGNIRLVNVPTIGATAGVEISGIYGIPRHFDMDTAIGTYGIPRSLPTALGAHTGTYGIPRVGMVEATNPAEFKIEYFRRGRQLTSVSSTFELPARYVKYVEHYALWRAYERQGSGQLMDLAMLYKGRFQDALARLQRRKNYVKSIQTPGFIGPMGAMQGREVNPRPAYPWNFGETI